jgi:hypothetical protein
MSRAVWYILAIVCLLCKMPVFAIVFLLLGLMASSR